MPDLTSTVTFPIPPSPSFSSHERPHHLQTSVLYTRIDLPMLCSRKHCPEQASISCFPRPFVHASMQYVTQHPWHPATSLPLQSCLLTRHSPCRVCFTSCMYFFVISLHVAVVTGPFASFRRDCLTRRFLCCSTGVTSANRSTHSEPHAQV